MTPDVLLVGHIAKDITDDGWRAGGGVLYAAAQCRKLGLNVSCVTACGPEIEPESLMPDVSWLVVRDESSTTFENRYAEGHRTQRLLARARPLAGEDIPDAWQAAPIVLLMSVFQDVEVDIISQFSCSATLLGVSTQGWLREVDITTVRQNTAIPDGRSWQGADALFVSEEDLIDSGAAAAWAEYVPAVALTRGRQGSVVWDNGVRHEVPAMPATEIDPTGAGDVFAAAFTVRLHEVGDVLTAARFASAAAALSVQGRGAEAVAEREAIEEILRREAA